MYDYYLYEEYNEPNAFDITTPTYFDNYDDYGDDFDNESTLIDDWDEDAYS